LYSWLYLPTFSRSILKRVLYITLSLGQGLLKQVGLLKSPIEAYFAHIVCFVVVD